MVLNRGIAFAKLLKQAQNAQKGLVQQSVRSSHGEWIYRKGTIPDQRNVYMAEAIGGVIWWWILYHLISEPGHIIGEFPYPDPSKWTDAELGIPPDDA